MVIIGVLIILLLIYLITKSTKLIFKILLAIPLTILSLGFILATILANMNLP